MCEVPEAVRSLPCFAGEGAGIVGAEKLSGGLQNLNFKVRRADGVVLVVRVPSDDAAEHGQDASTVHASARAAAACGVGPAIACFDAATGLLATRFLEGQVLSAAHFTKPPAGEPDRAGALLLGVVAVVKRLHERCEGMARSQASDVLGGYDLAPVPAPLRPQVEALQVLLGRTMGQFDGLVCCHNDLDPANIIVAEEEGGGDEEGTLPSSRTYLIDYEWSGPGDRVCDLATFCLLAGCDEGGEDRVLRAYFGDDLSVLHRARLTLWRLWFGVRGALWSAVKDASTRGVAAAGGELPCDYAAYAAEGWAMFAERAAAPAVVAAMQHVEEHTVHAHGGPAALGALE